MFVLADTSVWVSHFRSGNNRLIQYLNSAQVYIHPLIIGELSLGNLKDSAKTLTLLRQLPKTIALTDLEIFTLIEKQKLYGKGIGWIDCSLLGSCLLNQLKLFTYDKRLYKIAKELGVGV